MTEQERHRRESIAQALRRIWRDPNRRHRLSEWMRRQWQNPQYRRRISAKIKGWHATPETRRRMSLAFKRRWRDPAHRRKMIRALTKAWQRPDVRRRRIPISRRNLGPSLGARRLHRHLGDGWFLEFYTPTGFVDIANPALMVAVEVDGIDHRKPKQRRRDREKERGLRRLGWEVFRVDEAKCRRLRCRS